MGFLKGFVHEIFLSVQGEGLFVGEVHAFVRMGGCPLRCRYCDTPEGLTPRRQGKILFPEMTTKLFSNPVTVEFVKDAVKSLTEHAPFSRMCITGGEPTYQKEFLKGLVALADAPVVLETAGVYPSVLKEISDANVHVSLDVKFPRSSGIRNGWDIFQEALINVSSSSLSVKAVVSGQEEPEEVKRAAELTARIHGEQVPFFIQPVEKIPYDLLMSFYRIACEHLTHVRVIPQVHKCLDLP